MARTGAFDNEPVLQAADQARTVEKIPMIFTYGTSTSDGTPSIGDDQPSDVSSSDVAGSFYTEAVTVTSRPTIPRQRDLAALEPAPSAETSQGLNLHVGSGRELPSTIPDNVENNWVLLAKSKLSGKIFGRILRLAQDAESPGRAALRTGSLRTFLSFWYRVSVLAPEPEVTLARNGNLVSWNQNTVHF